MKKDTRTPEQILADLCARAATKVDHTFIDQLRHAPVRTITMDDLADFRRQADEEAMKPLPKTLPAFKWATMRKDGDDA